MKQPCRNCGRPAGPRFCGFCGQEVDAHRRSAWALLGELLASWFSLEGRLFRTLGVLWRPGRLTLRYLAGQRAPNLRPMRLYVLASLLLVSSLLALRAPDASEVSFRIAGKLVTAEETADAGRQVTLFAPESPSMRWIGGRWEERLERLQQAPPQRVLDQLFAGLRRMLPAALVLSLPLLAVVLKLLFVRTGTLLVDHLVFALHFQSALFLALVAAWALARLPWVGLLAELLLYVATFLAMVAVYLPLALRRVYGQPRWLTAVKTLLLIYGYLKVMQLALGLAVAFAVWRM